MKNLYVIFDGPPSHEPGRFVEVEDEQRASVSLNSESGGWEEDVRSGYPDGHPSTFWRLGPFSVLDEDDKALLALARLLFIESTDFGYADFYRHNGEPRGTLTLDGQLTVPEEMLAMLERNGWTERPGRF